MSNPFLFVALLLFLCCNAKAQKGNNQLSILAETSVPIYQNDQGFGGYIKGLYGLGGSAQLTLTAGISIFRTKNTVEFSKTTTRLIPVMAGYKLNIHKFYIEPQIGFGELGGKITSNGDFARPSVGALFWALGAGFTFNRISAGLRFQDARGIEGNSAGAWHNKNFHYTGMHIAYNIFQRKS